LKAVAPELVAGMDEILAEQSHATSWCSCAGQSSAVRILMSRSDTFTARLHGVGRRARP
jgi:hypothetical protein